MQLSSPRHAVIFCTVIDNFGDIGVCWRLARQLHHEQQWQVTLYVDDLPSFGRICPALDVGQLTQTVQGISVVHWQAERLQFPASLSSIDLCIEAFACEVPIEFIQALNHANPAALWVNLEYLTAESWAADCHLLPSPQRGVRLAKYFFFPGFTKQTGGLLREQSVVAQAAQVAAQPATHAAYWQQIGLTPPPAGSFVISLFAYSQQGIASWFAQLSSAEHPVHIWVADGALAQALRIEYPALADGRYQQGQLSIEVMPFVAQPDYDLVLALCDLNFVRGEDSVIRAHWAGKPFIWQIYRQQDAAHLEKLQAFLQLMLEDCSAELREFILQLHLAWEQETDFASCWPEFFRRYAEIAQYSKIWQQKLIQQQDLVSNLVRFVENQHIIRRNFS